MKVSLISDVHAEFYKNNPNWLPPLPDDPDVLVLAGDIHVGERLIDFLDRVSRVLPETHLVVVAGNHEFYRQIRNETLHKYQETFESHPRIHFLENDFVDIGDIRFIGATLWTGFPLYSMQFTTQQVMAYANESMSDFALIRETSGSKTLVFNPSLCKAIFDKSKKSIEQMLVEAGSKKCIVVTHFPPSKELRHPKFQIDMATSYFNADCTDIIEKYQPAYWFYGHNHWSSTINISNTILMSNQFGYPNERWKMGGSFNPNLMLEC